MIEIKGRRSVVKALNVGAGSRPCVRRGCISVAQSFLGGAAVHRCGNDTVLKTTF